MLSNYPNTATSSTAITIVIDEATLSSSGGRRISSIAAMLDIVLQPSPPWMNEPRPYPAIAAPHSRVSAPRRVGARARFEGIGVRNFAKRRAL